ncbi:bacteriohemerythrin [Wielerella bovis]|uniref:bacteriohemerythrin n=1 Tax=Wielerella bovis TaxID=2917790 RepID=UPI002019B4F2|nr:bacteriohemerythrin [Wielerella bovis]MCG7656079.1 bacteriohemerythrin [Wielerella bovis]MCG7658305.1 bacteriohemerythrin [Wielerella bovis]
MSFVLWTADLATGFADIDEQHQILLSRINGFYDAMQSGNFVDSKIALQDLIDYTAEHFAYEEKMLEEANYHMLEPHKKVHANFVAKMEGLQSRYENGEIEAAQELLDILEGWLFRHIRLNDHGYVESVKQAGVRA